MFDADLGRPDRFNDHIGAAMKFGILADAQFWREKPGFCKHRPAE